MICKKLLNVQKRFHRRNIGNMKKITLFMLVFIMLFSTVAFASDMDYVENGQEQAGVVESSEIQPRYTYIQVMSAGLEIDENGHASFSGSVRAPYRNVRLSLYLQRSKNGILWDNIQGGIKTVYDSGGIGYERDLPKEDYFYRAKLVVEVLDDDKNVIETQTIYSDSKRY